MEKTVTQIIEEVKEDICDNYCKYNEQCWKRIEDGEFDTIVCPLDRL